MGKHTKPLPPNTKRPGTWVVRLQIEEEDT